jgi:ATP-binding cassette subfamily B protein
MVISSISELLSLGAIMPFISVLIAPENFLNNAVFKKLTIGSFFVSYQSLILTLTLFLLISVLIAAGLRTLVLWATINLAFKTGADITKEIYSKVLYKEYSYHINTNTSLTIDLISRKIDEVVYYALIPSLSIVSSSIVILFMIFGMFFILPSISLFLILILGFIYLIILIICKTKLRISGEIASKRSAYSIKIIQESLGGIRDVLINNLQEYFFNIFIKNDENFRKSQATVLYLSQFPRYSIEAVGMFLVIGLSYILVIHGDSKEAMPILAALAIGAQRMLPAFQQVYAARATIEGSKNSISALLGAMNDLNINNQLELHNAKNIKNQTGFIFNKIELRNVSFKYPCSEKYVLVNINLVIEKGDKIGIIGDTGSGKSTLVDMLMGLIKPSFGQILVNDIPIENIGISTWQTCLAHVPQSIFLSDGSIAENIAFGMSEELIRLDEIRECAKNAQILDVVSAMKDGFMTNVGENGALLSGGQRQRIAIARALYKNASILFFDEATSALDGQTEDTVISSILKTTRSFTMIMIAHKLDTLVRCNRIYKIENKTCKSVDLFQK